MGDNRETSSLRISDVGWLEDTVNERITNVVRRVEAITGLDITTHVTRGGETYFSSDQFQVGILCRNIVTLIYFD